VIAISGQSSDVSESFLSSQRHKPLESESSDIFSSRVTGTVESLRVIGLQARVNVESHELSRFFYDIFLLWNGTRSVRNCAQCCFNKVWLQVIYI